MAKMQATLNEIKHITMIERRRCVGIVLEEYGIHKLQGHDEIAHVLDALATRLERTEREGN
jgi:hypothetical protein